MLRDLGNVDNIPAFIDRVKSKGADHAQLMGFGHRVYKNFDPRAKLIKADTDVILGQLGLTDPLLEIAKKLEEIALNDDYFISRKLYPNVDFYSGITLKALGFPVQMFTPLFALARVTGWISQWKEMVEQGPLKIGRPRQQYEGRMERKYVAVAGRMPSASARDTVGQADATPVALNR